MKSYFDIIVESNDAKSKFTTIKKETSNLIDKYFSLQKEREALLEKLDFAVGRYLDSLKKDMDWLCSLSTTIEDCTGIKSPVSGYFFGSSFKKDTIKEANEVFKKVMPYLKKNVVKCLDKLDKYVEMNIDECEDDVRKELKELNIVLTYDDDKQKINDEIHKLEKSLTDKFNDLNSFADFVLRGYDKDSSERKFRNLYPFEEKVKYMQEILNKLDNEKNRFEKNMSDNEYYQNTKGLNFQNW